MRGVAGAAVHLASLSLCGELVRGARELKHQSGRTRRPGPRDTEELCRQESRGVNLFFALERFCQAARGSSAPAVSSSLSPGRARAQRCARLEAGGQMPWRTVKRCRTRVCPRLAELRASRLTGEKSRQASEPLGTASPKRER